MKAGNFPKCLFMTVAGAAMMLMVTGCGDRRKVPENSLAFADVVYVEDGYPVTWELAQGDTLALPVLGVSDFVVKDSLLIVSNNDNAGRVTVLSLDGGTVYGKFLRMGRGPGEIVSFNGVSSVQFSHKENGHLTACWTEYAGNLMEWDVTASLESGRTELASRSLELQDSPWLLDAVPLDGQEFLIVHAGADRNSINRFILTSEGEKRTIPPLDRLNSATVKAEPESGSGSVVGSGDMVSFTVPGFNLINGSHAYESSRGLIVEAERTLNTMNIFSADGTYARTVCIYGDKVDDVSSVENYSDARLALRPKTYPDFISVLHWLREPEVKQYVRLFGYEGEPLAEIPLPEGGIFYDMDIPGGCLYVLISGQELLIKYDVSSLLEDIIPSLEQ